MAFQDSSLMDESLPPPEASPTRPPTRGFDPSANPPLPPSDQPKPDDRPPEKFVNRQPPPEPPPSAEPYIPSRHDYPHTQWGEDDFILRGARKYPGVLQSPYMPQERDFASLLHNTVMWFGRFGSPHVAIPAIAMGNYASAYWTAYQKGMHERAGTAWQQYQHAQRMMLDRQKQELMEAREIVALYKDDPHRFEQEMRTLSAKYGDDKYLNAAIEKGPAAVEAWMAAKNGKYLDAAKAAQQQRAAEDLHKAREQEYQLRIDQEKRRQRAEQEREEQRKRLEEERRRIDPNAPPVPLSAIPAAPAEPPVASTPEPPTAEGGGEESDGEEATPSDAASASPDTAPDETPGTKPAGLIQTADASGTVPIGGGGQTRGVEPSEVIRNLEPEGKPEVPFLEEAAKGWVFSNKMPASLDKKTMPDFLQRAENRGEQLKSWLDRLESDPSINPRTISPSIRKYFPSLADKIDGYLAGKLSPPPASRSNPEWQRAIALGFRINPEFSQGTFQSRQQGLAGWTRGDRGQNLSSLGIAMKHAETLLDHLGKKPWPYTAEIARRFGGKDTALLDSDIETFSEEYVRAMSGKGPTIPELRGEAEKLNLNYPESYLRNLVEERIHLLQTKLREKQDQFVSETGFPAQDILKRFKAYTETDPLATNRDRQGIDGLERLNKWKPSDGSTTMPPGAPAGSRIGRDPTSGKRWLVHPDGSVHELNQ